MSERKALFLDRDGVLTAIVRRGSVISSARSQEEFRLLLEAAPLLSQARQAGYLTVLVTNQPDVARGLLAPELLDDFHRQLQESFELDALEVCAEDGHDNPRRKPNPGMLLDAAARLGIDLSRSYFLGDTGKDVEAGKRAGVKTILLKTDYNQQAREQADFVVATALDALPILLNKEGTHP